MDDVYILMLRHEADKRMVPVLITREDSEMIYYALRSRPNPAAALLRSVILSFDMQVERVVIEFPFRGRTAARIWMRQGEASHVLPTTTGIGVCLALQLHVELCISATDYEALTRHICEETRVALPLTVLSDRLLREALDEAVRDERFELASVLRDELRTRENEAPAAPESSQMDTESTVG